MLTESKFFVIIVIVKSIIFLTLKSWTVYILIYLIQLYDRLQ